MARKHSPIAAAQPEPGDGANRDGADLPKRSADKNHDRDRGYAARTRLKTLRRNASRTVQVAAVPNPAIQLGDVVLLTCERLGITAEVGVIGAFSLPYLSNGGSMQLTIRLDA